MNMNANDTVLESFMNFCDEMQIVEEGLLSKVKDKFKKSASSLPSKGASSFPSFDAALNSGISNEPLTVSSSNGSFQVIFHGKSIENKEQVKKLYQLVIGSSKKICSLCLDLTIRETDDVSSSDKPEYLKTAKIDWIEFREKDGVVSSNAFVNSELSTQYYMKNIKSSADIKAANVDYND